MTPAREQILLDALERIASCTVSHHAIRGIALKSIAEFKAHPAPAMNAITQELLAALEACLEQLVAYEEKHWLGDAWRSRVGLHGDIARARAAIVNARYVLAQDEPANSWGLPLPKFAPLPALDPVPEHTRSYLIPKEAGFEEPKP